MTDPPTGDMRLSLYESLSSEHSKRNPPTQDASDHTAACRPAGTGRGQWHSAHLASSGDSAIRWKVLSARMMSMPFSLLVLSTISLHGDESATRG